MLCGGAAAPQVPLDPDRHMRLVEWVWEYYAREPARPPGTDGPQPVKLQSSAVIVSGRPPLYFQHQARRSPPLSPSPALCSVCQPLAPPLTTPHTHTKCTDGSFLP
jgi:hypothetical protein